MFGNIKVRWRRRRGKGVIGESIRAKEGLNLHNLVLFLGLLQKKL